MGDQDKVNATRLMILDASGNRRLQVDPSCKKVIRSMRNLEFKPGLSVPDPTSEHGHMCDALGYACIVMSKGLTPYVLVPRHSVCGESWLEEEDRGRVMSRQMRWEINAGAYNEQQELQQNHTPEAQRAAHRRTRVIDRWVWVDQLG